MTKTYRMTAEQVEKLVELARAFCFADQPERDFCAHLASLAVPDSPPPGAKPRSAHDLWYAIRNAILPGGESSTAHDHELDNVFGDLYGRDSRRRVQAAIAASLEGAPKWRIGDRVALRYGFDLKVGTVFKHFVELGTMSGGQVVAEDQIESLAERAARLRAEAAACEAEAEKGSKE